MSGAISTVRLWLMEERPTAVKLGDQPRIMEGVAVRIIWLPRSLIAYARKQKAATPGDLPTYTFTLPDWKIEELNLWSFVQS